MMEPLLDEQDQALEAELIRAGKNVDLSPAARNRLLMMLGVSVGVAATGKAAAATGIVGKLLGGKSLAVAAASMGALGAAVYLAAGLAGPSEPELPPPATLVEGTPVRGTLPPPSSPEEPLGAAARTPEIADAPEAALAEEATRRTFEATKNSANRPSVGRTLAPTPALATTSEKAGLGEELALLEAASGATRSGNAALALQRLTEYQRRFPKGKLALEARVLRIEALAGAGRKPEAQRLARAFLKGNPNSPIAARIRRYAE
jgi:hypothetical protein